MLYIDHEQGGLRISRWEGEDPKPLESIFVATDELAALLADLLSAANGGDAAENWDAYACLAGNPALTLTASK